MVTRKGFRKGIKELKKGTTEFGNIGKRLSKELGEFDQAFEPKKKKFKFQDPFG